MRWSLKDYVDYQARRLQKDAKPKQVVRDEPLAEKKGEARHTGRVAVSITAFQVRLLDPDNLCPKHLIDGLRYAGLIHDDNPEEIILTVSQKKVRTKEEERTEVELTYE